MFRFVTAAALCAGLTFSLFSRVEAATGTSAMPCAGSSLQDLASRTHAKATPCVAPRHRFILETTYYQNASRIGGSALAAYPEARIRYGMAPRLELFVDTPSEIAKSGERGRGIYFMTQTGIGGKFEVARAHGVVYSLSAEGHPPLGALANLNLRPLSDVHLSANWSGVHRRQFGVEVGSVNYETAFFQRFRSSSLLAGTVTQHLDARTSFTLELANESNVYLHARSQSSGVMSVERTLNEHLLFDLELGDAFNAAGNSKPHYLGAGFTIR